MDLSDILPLWEKNIYKIFSLDKRMTSTDSLNLHFCLPFLKCWSLIECMLDWLKHYTTGKAKSITKTSICRNQEHLHDSTKISSIKHQILRNPFTMSSALQMAFIKSQILGNSFITSLVYRMVFVKCQEKLLLLTF